MEYTEHEKLSEVHEKSQAVGDFLFWLGAEKGIVLAEWVLEDELHGNPDPDPDGEQVLFQTNFNTEKLLAEFFGIDLKRLEEEKQHMLDGLREENRVQEEE